MRCKPQTLMRAFAVYIVFKTSPKRRNPALLRVEVMFEGQPARQCELRSTDMPANALKTEAELRTAVIDRLIAASLRDSKPVREATLERWRTMSVPARLPPKSEIPVA